MSGLQNYPSHGRHSPIKSHVYEIAWCSEGNRYRGSGDIVTSISNRWGIIAWTVGWRIRRPRFLRSMNSVGSRSVGTWLYTWRSAQGCAQRTDTLGRNAKKGGTLRQLSDVSSIWKSSSHHRVSGVPFLLSLARLKIARVPGHTQSVPQEHEYSGKRYGGTAGAQGSPPPKEPDFFAWRFLSQRREWVVSAILNLRRVVLASLSSPLRGSETSFDIDITAVFVGNIHGYSAPPGVLAARSERGLPASGDRSSIGD